MVFGSGSRIMRPIPALESSVSVGRVRLAEAVNRKMYVYYVGIPHLPTRYYNLNRRNVYNISPLVLACSVPPHKSGNRNDAATDKGRRAGATTAERK